ncbi:MAG: succinylglutamate desuccinylase/aspartoacylase family protein [Caldilineaceae bacterium]
MSINTPVFTNVDYHKDGKQFGQLSAPISTNSAGWANYFVPICVIKNGEGPTALISGGNHGDEYEGPVTLMNLARWVEPEMIRGRLILIPMLNKPAVQAGTRLSPIDGSNMNRAFTGKPSDSLTGMIAYYMSQVLVPLADLVIDIHSGGRSMHFLPSVNMHSLENKPQMQAMLDTAAAWGAPYRFIYRDVAGSGLLPSYCEALGKVTLGTELGSASQFSVTTLKIASEGLRNALRFAKILVDQPIVAPTAESKVVAAEEVEDYVMTPVSGIYEPFCELGDRIEAGQLLGQVHLIEQPFIAPIPVYARTSGILFVRRAFPLTTQGECVAVIVRPYSL